MPTAKELMDRKDAAKLYHAWLPTGDKFTVRKDTTEWPLCGTEAEWKRMVAADQFKLELVGALPFLPEGSIALTEVFPDVRDPAEPTAIEQPQPANLGPLANRKVRELTERQGSWIDVELDDDHLMLNMTVDEFWALPAVFKGTTSFVQIGDRWVNTDRIRQIVAVEGETE